MKKILLFIANRGFQPLEYNGTKEELEKAGLTVVTGGAEVGVAIGKDNITKANIEVSLHEINIQDYDGLYFIGGPGALEYLDNNLSYDILQKWQKTSKPYGAICISTRILAKAGVLQNKTATGWNGDNELPDILEENMAKYSSDDVFRDGKVVTASGPMAAHDFGKEIAKDFI